VSKVVPKRRRILPAKRWQRALIWIVIALGYMALMWFLIFPWVDRTFVNRPAL
jgi:hypothetical protein